MPPQQGYLDAGRILQVPHLQFFVDRYRNAAKAADFSLLGSFGTEVILVLYLAIEEQIRMRSIALPHAVHFYKDGTTSSRDMDTPQVVWTGELFLSDEAVQSFTDLELELLMTHEAMHLMRPNFFMILSAADLTQRLYFPDLWSFSTSSASRSKKGPRSHISILFL